NYLYLKTYNLHINEAGLRKQKCQNTNSEIKNNVTSLVLFSSIHHIAKVAKYAGKKLFYFLFASTTLLVGNIKS
ncbi:hypothetical protein, partial [Bacteroides faecis]|uniref:hypothetical protein n=1 Tax=Bacteroides faecis TaxID=674529 RepID=UPI0034A3D9DB